MVPTHNKGTSWTMVPNGASCGIICTFFVAEFPLKTATCLQVGPMSLDWPVDPFARFDLSRPSLFPEVPNDDQQRGDLPASTRSRWRQNALQAPPKVLQRITGWDGHGPFLAEGLRCVTWITRGSHWICFLQAEEQGSQAQIPQKVIYQQQHCMSPGSTWKRRESPSYPGVGSAVSVIWYLLS